MRVGESSVMTPMAPNARAWICTTQPGHACLEDCCVCAAGCSQTDDAARPSHRAQGCIVSCPPAGALKSARARLESQNFNEITAGLCLDLARIAYGASSIVLTFLECMDCLSEYALQCVMRVGKKYRTGEYSFCVRHYIHLWR
jgi:hypothetical protein